MVEGMSVHKRSLIAYFGLYCRDCFSYRGEIADSARNLQENPKVAVIVVDRDKSDGYQVKGTVELLTSGDFFEQVARRQEERRRPRPKHVVKLGLKKYILSNQA